jgi:hypothetical protein
MYSAPPLWSEQSLDEEPTPNDMDVGSAEDLWRIWLIEAGRQEVATLVATPYILKIGPKRPLSSYPYRIWAHSPLSALYDHLQI